MPTSPRSRNRTLFLFCDFFWTGPPHRRWRNANLRVILTILVIAAAPCAQAQTPAPTQVTKADAQKVVKIISGDKAKTQTYCDIGKLNEQIEEANEKKDIKKTEELSQQIDALGKKLGPEYAALMDGLQEVDPESEDGKQIGLMFEPLDKLCAR